MVTTESHLSQLLLRSWFRWKVLIYKQFMALLLTPFSIACFVYPVFIAFFISHWHRFIQILLHVVPILFDDGIFFPFIRIVIHLAWNVFFIQFHSIFYFPKLVLGMDVFQSHCVSYQFCFMLKYSFHFRMHRHKI